MKQTKIKICGIQSVETARSMLHLDVNYVGFVFAPSRRQIGPVLAKEMADVLGPTIKTAGVFVNPTHEQLTNILEQVQLDIVQLHGQESAGFCEEVRGIHNVKVMKVFSIRDDIQEQHIMKPYADRIDALLLDTYEPTVGGGSGQTFSWHRVSNYKKWCEHMSIPMFVAGGLHQDNVVDLLSSYNPDGVDISSGVETNGQKDLDKMITFVERVRAYDSNA